MQIHKRLIAIMVTPWFLTAPLAPCLAEIPGGVPFIPPATHHQHMEHLYSSGVLSTNTNVPVHHQHMEHLYSSGVLSTNTNVPMHHQHMEHLYSSGVLSTNTSTGTTAGMHHHWFNVFSTGTTSSNSNGVSHTAGSTSVYHHHFNDTASVASATNNATYIHSGTAPSINLNLSSTAANVTAGHILQNQSVVINIAGVPTTVNANTLLTPAEKVAVYQVLGSHTQTITLDAQGSADGGVVVITPHLSQLLGSLTIPSGVTVIDLSKGGILNLAGNLVDDGNLYITASNPTLSTLTVDAGNINVQSGGLLSDILPAGGLNGISNILPSLNLDLNSQSSITNAGTITSSGSLGLTAGRGDITNSGLIASTGGNINIAASNPATNININGAGGTFEALNGNINVGAVTTETGNINMTGGNYLSQNLNINDGSTGAVNANVDQVTGTLNITAGSANFTASTGTLNIGNEDITGDPTFYNTGGNVDISGNLEFNGEDLAIVAEGNIVNTKSGDIISTSSTGNGGNIVMIAGAQFTSSSQSGPTNSQVSNDTSSTLTITGGTNAGGYIDLTGGNGTGSGTTQISSLSSTGYGSGGNISLIAYGGNGTNAGTVNVPSTVTINANGGVVGGNVVIIAGLQGGASTNAINVGPISTASTVWGPKYGVPDGAVSLVLAAPTFTTGTTQFTLVDNSNGSVTGSTSLPYATTATSGLPNSALQNTSMVVGAITSNSTLTLTSGTGNLGTSSSPVNTNASTIVLNSTGNVVIADTNNVSISSNASTTLGSLSLTDTASTGTGITVAAGGLTSTGAITLNADAVAVNGNISATTGTVSITATTVTNSAGITISAGVNAPTVSLTIGSSSTGDDAIINETGSGAITATTLNVNMLEVYGATASLTGSNAVGTLNALGLNAGKFITLDNGTTPLTIGTLTANNYTGLQGLTVTSAGNITTTADYTDSANQGNGANNYLNLTSSGLIDLSNAFTFGTITLNGSTVTVGGALTSVGITNGGINITSTQATAGTGIEIDAPIVANGQTVTLTTDGYDSNTNYSINEGGAGTITAGSLVISLNAPLEIGSHTQTAYLMNTNSVGTLSASDALSASTAHNVNLNNGTTNLILGAFSGIANLAVSSAGNITTNASFANSYFSNSLGLNGITVDISEAVGSGGTISITSTTVNTGTGIIISAGINASTVTLNISANSADDAVISESGSGTITAGTLNLNLLEIYGATINLAGSGNNAVGTLNVAAVNTGKYLTLNNGNTALTLGSLGNNSYTGLVGLTVTSAGNISTTTDYTSSANQADPNYNYLSLTSSGTLDLSNAYSFGTITLSGTSVTIGGTLTSGYGGVSITSTQAGAGTGILISAPLIASGQTVTLTASGYDSGSNYSINETGTGAITAGSLVINLSDTAGSTIQTASLTDTNAVGTLSASDLLALASHNVDLNNGTTNLILGAFSGIANLAVSSAGNITTNASFANSYFSNSLGLNGITVDISEAVGSGGTISITSTQTGAGTGIEIDAPIIANGQTVTLTANGYDGGVSGPYVINEGTGGAITAGTLTINFNNTTANTATANLANANTVGTFNAQGQVSPAVNDVTFNNGSTALNIGYLININNFNSLSTGPLTFSSSFTTAGNLDFSTDANSITINSGVTITANSITLDLVNGGTFTDNGSLVATGGPGSGGITIDPPGPLTLTGVASFSPGTGNFLTFTGSSITLDNGLSYTVTSGSGVQLLTTSLLGQAGGTATITEQSTTSPVFTLTPYAGAPTTTLEIGVGTPGTTAINLNGASVNINAATSVTVDSGITVSADSNSILTLNSPTVTVAGTVQGGGTQVFTTNLTDSGTITATSSTWNCCIGGLGNVLIQGLPANALGYSPLTINLTGTIGGGNTTDVNFNPGQYVGSGTATYGTGGYGQTGTTYLTGYGFGPVTINTSGSTSGNISSNNAIYINNANGSNSNTYTVGVWVNNISSPSGVISVGGNTTIVIASGDLTIGYIVGNGSSNPVSIIANGGSISLPNQTWAAINVAATLSITASGNVQLTTNAAQTITATNGITVQAGGDYSTVSGSSVSTTNAPVSVTAGGDITSGSTISSGALTLDGNTVAVNGNVTATGTVSIAATTTSAADSSTLIAINANINASGQTVNLTQSGSGNVDNDAVIGGSGVITSNTLNITDTSAYTQVTSLTGANAVSILNGYGSNSNSTITFNDGTANLTLGSLTFFRSIDVTSSGSISTSNSTNLISYVPVALTLVSSGAINLTNTLIDNTSFGPDGFSSINITGNTVAIGADLVSGNATISGAVNITSTETTPSTGNNILIYNGGINAPGQTVTLTVNGTNTSGWIINEGTSTYPTGYINAGILNIYSNSTASGQSVIIGLYTPSGPANDVGAVNVIAAAGPTVNFQIDNGSNPIALGTFTNVNNLVVDTAGAITNTTAESLSGLVTLIGTGITISNSLSAGGNINMTSTEPSTITGYGLGDAILIEAPVSSTATINLTTNSADTSGGLASINEAGSGSVTASTLNITFNSAYGATANLIGTNAVSTLTGNGGNSTSNIYLNDGTTSLTLGSLIFFHNIDVSASIGINTEASTSLLSYNPVNLTLISSGAINLNNTLINNTCCGADGFSSVTLTGNTVTIGAALVSGNATISGAVNITSTQTGDGTGIAINAPLNAGSNTVTLTAGGYDNGTAYVINEGAGGYITAGTVTVNFHNTTANTATANLMNGSNAISLFNAQGQPALAINNVDLNIGSTPLTIGYLININNFNLLSSGPLVFSTNITSTGNLDFTTSATSITINSGVTITGNSITFDLLNGGSYNDNGNLVANAGITVDPVAGLTLTGTATFAPGTGNVLTFSDSLNINLANGLNYTVTNGNGIVFSTPELNVAGTTLLSHLLASATVTAPSITVNSPIGDNLTLGSVSTLAGVFNFNGPVYIGNSSATLSINAAVNGSSTVSLTAGSDGISQGLAGSLVAPDGLTVNLPSGGTAALDTALLENNVASLTGTGSGTINLNNGSNNVELLTFGGSNQNVIVTTSGAITTGADIVVSSNDPGVGTLTLNGGTVTLSNEIITGGNVYITGTSTSAGTDININAALNAGSNNSVSLTTDGHDGNSGAYAINENASGSITAGTLNIALDGSGRNITSTANLSAGTNAVGTLNAGGNFRALNNVYLNNGTTALALGSFSNIYDLDVTKAGNITTNSSFNDSVFGTISLTGKTVTLTESFTSNGAVNITGTSTSAGTGIDIGATINAPNQVVTLTADGTDYTPHHGTPSYVITETGSGSITSGTLNVNFKALTDTSTANLIGSNAVGVLNATGAAGAPTALNNVTLNDGSTSLTIGSLTNINNLDITASGGLTFGTSFVISGNADLTTAGSVAINSLTTLTANTLTFNLVNSGTFTNNGDLVATSKRGGNTIVIDPPANLILAGAGSFAPGAGNLVFTATQSITLAGTLDYSVTNGSGVVLNTPLLLGASGASPTITVSLPTTQFTLQPYNGNTLEIGVEGGGASTNITLTGSQVNITPQTFVPQTLQLDNGVTLTATNNVNIGASNINIGGGSLRATATIATTGTINISPILTDITFGLTGPALGTLNLNGASNNISSLLGNITVDSNVTLSSVNGITLSVVPAGLLGTTFELTNNGTISGDWIQINAGNVVNNGTITATGNSPTNVIGDYSGNIVIQSNASGNALNITLGSSGSINGMDVDLNPTGFGSVTVNSVGNYNGTINAGNALYADNANGPNTSTASVDIFVNSLSNNILTVGGNISIYAGNGNLSAYLIESNGAGKQVNLEAFNGNINVGIGGSVGIYTTGSVNQSVVLVANANTGTITVDSGSEISSNLANGNNYPTITTISNSFINNGTVSGNWVEITAANVINNGSLSALGSSNQVIGPYGGNIVIQSNAANYALNVTLGSGSTMNAVNLDLNPYNYGNVNVNNSHELNGTIYAANAIYIDNQNTAVGNTNIYNINFYVGNLSSSGNENFVTVGGNTKIEAANGNINVWMVQANGTGNVELTAKNGNVTVGVLNIATPGVTTNNGTVTIIANGNFTVEAGSTVTTGSNNTITVTASDIYLADNAGFTNGSLNAGTGTVTLLPYGNTENVIVGAKHDDHVLGDFNVTGQALGNITAGTLVVGRLTDTGNFNVAGPVNVSGTGAGAYNLKFYTGGTYTNSSTVTLGDKNLYVDAIGGAFTGVVKSSYGDITINTDGVLTVNGNITVTNAGIISLTGNTVAVGSRIKSNGVTDITSTSDKGGTGITIAAHINVTGSGSSLNLVADGHDGSGSSYVIDEVSGGQVRATNLSITLNDSKSGQTSTAYLDLAGGNNYVHNMTGVGGSAGVHNIILNDEAKKLNVNSLTNINNLWVLDSPVYLGSAGGTTISGNTTIYNDGPIYINGLVSFSNGQALEIISSGNIMATSKKAEITTSGGSLTMLAGTTDSAPGGVITISTTGSAIIDLSKSTQAFVINTTGLTNGGNITLTANGGITVGNLTANGGTFFTGDSGGNITLTSNNGSISTGNIEAEGGNGAFFFIAFNGGAGGNVSLTALSSGATITAGSINVNGGNGANAILGTGGTGGAGGTITLLTNAAGTTDSLTADGGSGGNSVFGTGGNGGDGGNIVFILNGSGAPTYSGSIPSNFIGLSTNVTFGSGTNPPAITVNGNVTATGGNGGNSSGSISGDTNGGTGGNGGNVWFQAGSITLTGGFSVLPGTGGDPPSNGNITLIANSYPTFTSLNGIPGYFPTYVVTNGGTITIIIPLGPNNIPTPIPTGLNLNQLLAYLDALSALLARDQLTEQIGTRIATDYDPWLLPQYWPKTEPLQGEVEKLANNINGTLFAGLEFSQNELNTLAGGGVEFGPNSNKDLFELMRGNVFFMPKHDIRVKTREGIAYIPKGCVAWIMETGADSAIYDCHDNIATGRIKVEVNGKKLALAPGMQVLLTKDPSSDFASLNPGYPIGYRNVASADVGKGVKVYVCSFSLPHIMANIPVIHDLLKSGTPRSIKVANAMIKNAVILNDLTGSEGYQTNMFVASKQVPLPSTEPSAEPGTQRIQPNEQLVQPTPAPGPQATRPAAPQAALPVPGRQTATVPVQPL